MGRSKYRLAAVPTFVATMILLAAVPTWGQVCAGDPPELVPDDGPLLPARTFNSKLELSVSVPSKGPEPKYIGSTPSDKPLNIPSCQVWFVTPNGDISMEALALEMQNQSIPGLWQYRYAKDAVLAALKDLKELRYVDVHASKGVTDAGLAYLKGLTGLRSLDLMNTKVTDVGLANLRNLTGLRNLDLTLTGVTDAGLVYLKNLTGLQSLGLSDTKVTDAGLKNLDNLKGLRGLSLSGTNVTDAGLAYLKGLTALKYLNLEQTKVTDAGLVYLRDMKALRMLVLRNRRAVLDICADCVNVSDGAVVSLQKALPDCNIRY